MNNETDNDINYELDAEGRNAGVESEDVGEDVILEPFDPRLIDVTTESRSLDTIMKRLSAGRIDLDPDFQRSRGIWSDRKKSQLIESLLLRIPLPSFYVAEIAGDDDVALGEDSWAVVDGIQRLSTIAEFVAPHIFDQSPLQLDGLQYLDNEIGKTFEQLSPALQLRVLESQFTMQIIRKATPEAVKLNIFARINTGGVPLSQQELRHALTPGPARHVLRDLAACVAFQEAVMHSVSPSRMADREMVLRYLAFRMHDPAKYAQQDFDNFLRSVMQEINRWDDNERKIKQREFEAVMETCFAIFGRDTFRKRYGPDHARRPVSKALFEAVSVAVATVRETSGTRAIKRLVSRSQVVRDAFVELMGDREFERSVSQGTGDPLRVRYRFGRLITVMQQAAQTS
ncbi:MAG TPA: DUF262 domain-containing protein [Solirubrobacteraceae bacterium]|nr:DUF262 domain-containing protein [Solirubrobacteraceae bacterium]